MFTTGKIMSTRRDVLKFGGTALALSPAVVSLLRGQAVSAAPQACEARKFWTMIGDYPHTHALFAHQVPSSCVTLDIAPEPVVFAAFARSVAMEFDVSELSLVTFLQARSFGRKLTLLPAVNLARFQHPYIVYNSAKGTMTPKDLEHARVGVRLFTATTPSWIRGILADDYGVDVAKMKWLAYQKPNVPEWKDPPNVTMIQQRDLSELLFSGEVDAIVADPVPKDPRAKSVIPDPNAAMKAWQTKHNAIQINHMVVVKEELTKSDPGAVREVWRLLKEAKRIGNEPMSEAAFHPFGLETNRHNIEIAIDYVYRTGMIPKRFSVDELFNEVTANLV
jgi:4,5-dihydroxyphthalate decarboxylase